ncbi:NADH dehydrogenase-like protein SAV0941 [Dermatophilus congolensis]|uniref:NADH:ubiquinone reductase (non-electrogenic) n=1 Tax=Dermatophilus congolensis TaxID=1863 RepID=A0AA46BNM2_9MICO|nr:NAD(P)/FAD-dependent oxidoreductase [Dermatophilus congolensis]STD10145.1 NADH dehydrogenase-like protein SAV0941 [Dermatophilus congolensis]
MTVNMGASQRHHVVIIGTGFGGLFAAKQFAHRKDVLVTIIGKTDHHLFQPLLYQVATGILSEGEIAPPIREILKHQRNARVILGLVDDIDPQAKTVTSRLHDNTTVTPYDTLIVASGASQSYFGNDHFATYAPGMKSIDDALELRSRIFNSFERAELTEDPVERDRLLTFVVVGAGPTGVEMAGQIRELSSHTLAKEFRKIDSRQAKVILVDGAKEVLANFGDKLGSKARRSLQDLGVDVRLGGFVTHIDGDGVDIKYADGRTEHIEAATKVWAAGVQGNRLGRVLADKTPAEVDRTGRVIVKPDLTIEGHPEIFVIGDLMAFEGVPGVAQGAIQSGGWAARTVIARLDGNEKRAAQPFTYNDKGSMAIISKYRGVANVKGFKFSGFIAWSAWLAIHLLFLVGFKSRVSTLIRWAITFLSDDRSERVTTHQQMVGRLAMRQLGQGVSGSLLRGEKPRSKGERIDN